MYLDQPIQIIFGRKIDAHELQLIDISFAQAQFLPGLAEPGAGGRAGLFFMGRGGRSGGFWGFGHWEGLEV